MSDNTLAALEDAIRAHVSDENDREGEWVTSWALAIALAPETNGDSAYWLAAPDGQPTHITVGLLDLARDHALTGERDGD